MGRGRLSAYSPHKPDVISVTPGALDRSPQEVRASRISSMYREEKHPIKIDNRNTVGPVQSLREHVLKASLFPNIFNRSTVKSSD